MTYYATGNSLGELEVVLDWYNNLVDEQKKPITEMVKRLEKQDIKMMGFGLATEIILRIMVKWAKI